MFQTFQHNTNGRDFVVGDIHGCFSALESLLKQANFNPEKDRLFSVGDLVDRGPECVKSIEWLAKPWFFAVLGNHEQLAIDAFASSDPSNILHHVSNGGGWFAKLDADRQAKFVNAFSKLPIAIEVPVGDKLCGIVHANPWPSNWNEIRKRLTDDSEPRALVDHTVSQILWSRARIRGIEEPQSVVGIDIVFVGHTVVPEPIFRANVLHIDQGGVFGQRLTMVDMDTLEFFHIRVPHSLTSF